MLNCDNTPKAKPILPLPFKSYQLLISIFLIATTYGCSQSQQKEVELEIQSIPSAQSNGLYQVAGTTNLPDGARISVSAVRYLLPKDNVQANLQGIEPRSNRSILSRQFATVKDGKWQTNLNLWQVAADGSYQEFWQKNQSQTPMIPENEVTFIATFDRASQDLQDKSVNAKLDSQGADAVAGNQRVQQIEGKLLRFTNSGERYVQATKSTIIAIPTGKTVPPARNSADGNGGWGDRHLAKTQPNPGGPPVTAAKSAQTNRPIQVSELLR